MSTLRRVLDRSEASLGHSIPIRKTVSGIWVPTPLTVLEAGCAVLEDLGFLGGVGLESPMVDAGTGDARVPCVLASRESRQGGPAVFGIELDPALFAQALINVETLEAKGVIASGRVQLVKGDYCDTAIYEACGLDFGKAGLVFNYPDGNEQRLARFVSAHGGDDTRLCVLTHDQELEVTELELLGHRDIELTNELPWRLSIYGRA